MIEAPQRIGSYHGRDVLSVAVEGVDDVGGLVLDHSLVLLDVAAAGLTTAQREALAGQLVRLRPLGVFVSGPDAEAMFDALLHALETPSDPLPVMTNFSSAGLAESIDDFLCATWPAEEWWDRWQGYLLVSIGGSANRLQEAARHSLDGERAGRLPD